MKPCSRGRWICALSGLTKPVLNFDNFIWRILLNVGSSRAFRQPRDDRPAPYGVKAKKLMQRAGAVKDCTGTAEKEPLAMTLTL